jgi:nucleoside-diphosphate-sugar epimerase
MPFRTLKLDVVIDMVLITESQAEQLIDVFKGITRRIIGISSQDVYRAYGIMLGKESGELQPTPLTEDSDVRSVMYPYRGATPRSHDDPRRILDDYDKIPIEQALMHRSSVPATILRLPMVYGPGDYQHRLFEYLKRMDDERPAILLEKGLAQWKSSFGYVENVAHAICSAVANADAAENIYNVADSATFTTEEWVKHIARNIGWEGKVIPCERALLPSHLDPGFNTEQHLNVSTERIRQDLGYAELVPLDTALSRTVAWERIHPPAHIEETQYDYNAEDSVIETLEERIT